MGLECRICEVCLPCQVDNLPLLCVPFFLRLPASLLVRSMRATLTPNVAVLAFRMHIPLSQHRLSVDACMSGCTQDANL